MSDTPRTDALRNLYDHAAPVVELWQLAYDLERELNEAKAELKENEGVIAVWRGRAERAEAELARAMRVVEAARRYHTLRDVHSGSNLVRCFEEWEAGR